MALRLMVVLLAATTWSCSTPCEFEGTVRAAGERFLVGCAQCECSSHGTVECAAGTCDPPAHWCELGGYTWGEGEKIYYSWADGCSACTCRSDSTVSCDSRACPTSCTADGITYRMGETFPAGDACNSCRCYPGGGIGCTDMFCEPRLNGKADILFVIDDSAGMADKQQALIQSFAGFMQVLGARGTPLDLHLGIVTSDLGAGEFTGVPSCQVGGDQGLLQNTQRGLTCATAHLNDSSDRFLVYRNDSDGTTTTNFTGDIAEVFACYAAIGDQGCGFEHQLGSAWAAMDGCQTDSGCQQRANNGFLRPDALFALIVLTDEDESSAPPDTTLWDTSQTTLDSPLGPLTSYRQFEFGNLCDGQPPGRQQGARANCVPGNWDPDPHHHETMPEEFASSFRSLKPQNPRLVYVAVIAGPPAPVLVGADATGFPTLLPSCTGSLGSATPGIHFARFVSLFDGDRGGFFSICQDLETTMEQIATCLGVLVAP